MVLGTLKGFHSRSHFHIFRSFIDMSDGRYLRLSRRSSYDQAMLTKKCGSGVSDGSSLRSIRKRTSFSMVVITTFKTVTSVFPREGTEHQRNCVCTNVNKTTYCLRDTTTDKATYINKC
jgi:hypothetical protein